MWEALEIAQKGTFGIKENIVNTLVTEYELVRTKSGESIVEFELRWTHLINQWATLGRTSHQNFQVRKMLNILTNELEAKVIAIEETRGESMRSIVVLFWSLSEYEGKMKFKRGLDEMDDNKEKKRKV